MNRLLERADPAIGVEVDRDRLRALVDDRIGLEPIARPRPRRSGGPWVVAVAVAFAIVVSLAVPALLNRDGVSEFAPSGQVTDFPGLVSQVELAGGGVQTMAIDGDDIWVVTSLQNVLQRVSKNTNQIERTFDLDAYVEGVVAGGGYLWLLSYDNGGEVLRFDPDSATVDERITLGGAPTFARWFGGRLFVGSDQGETVDVSPHGELLATREGSLVGDGLGYLWLLDQNDGSLSSLAEDGTVGEIVIPASSSVLDEESPVRQVGAAGGYLWLIFGDYSESVVRFDPSTGELIPLHVGRWLHSMTEHDGALWVTSYTDHLLFRIDPESGEVERFALPGRPGGVQSIGGDLGVLLYQPGALIRIDPTGDLLEMGPEVVAHTFDASGTSPHTLVCTLGGVDDETLQRAQVERDFTGLGPTVVLEGPSWMGGGIWSMVQAGIEDRVVCASGHKGDAGTPQERADDLATALESAGIPGPYELVAAGDGVHTVRLFADGRDDISGVVLVEPMPLGFEDFYDDLLGDRETQGGPPQWLDIDTALSDSLTDFRGLPLVILSHEPSAVFLTERFVDYAGEETAQAVSDYWEDGMNFYAGLSTGSRRVSVADAGMEGVIWYRPEMVVDAIVGSARSDG